jgi:hypothetical protein
MRRALQDSPVPLSDEEYAEDLRSHLKRVIFSSWVELQSLAQLTHPLQCYESESPHELDDGIMIAIGPSSCAGAGCTLATDLRKFPNDLALIEATIRRQPAKLENQRRIEAVMMLQQTGVFDDKSCRALGDVVFAMLAPSEFVIITTNIKDQLPLAEALGKRALFPHQIP